MSATRVFRKNLKVARLQADNGLPITQEQLAQRIGVQKVTVSRMERGELLRWIEKLESLARALGKPIHWFFVDHDKQRQDAVA